MTRPGSLDKYAIDSEPRSVSWTETARVNIGHKPCDWCEKQSPSPTDTQVLSFVQNNPDTTTMWPFGGERDGEFIPARWSKGARLLCDECTEAARAALETAKLARTGISREAVAVKDAK
jgi:hypothetical protein